MCPCCSFRQITWAYLAFMWLGMTWITALCKKVCLLLSLCFEAFWPAWMHLIACFLAANIGLKGGLSDPLKRTAFTSASVLCSANSKAAEESFRASSQEQSLKLTDRGLPGDANACLKLCFVCSSFVYSLSLFIQVGKSAPGVTPDPFCFTSRKEIQEHLWKNISHPCRWAIV